jgi:hypothetical protein
MADFKLNFQCKGSRQPRLDAAGHRLYQLYRIEDKYTHGDELVYGVVYYEEQPRSVHPIPVSELQQQYPAQVQEWEKQFGKRWEQKHGDKGNPWQAGVKDPATPAGKQAPRSASAASDKRTFDDTPQKDKQDEPKKPKRDIFDLSDDEDEDGPKEPKKDIFDLPDDDDPSRSSVTARANAASSRGFNLPSSMAPTARPKPKFRAQTTATGALQDDDIEDSPTKGSGSRDKASSMLPTSPTKPTSASSRIPTRDGSAPQVRGGIPAGRPSNAGLGSTSSSISNIPLGTPRIPNFGVGSIQVRPGVRASITHPFNAGPASISSIPQARPGVASSAARPSNPGPASTSSTPSVRSGVPSTAQTTSTSSATQARLGPPSTAHPSKAGVRNVRSAAQVGASASSLILRPSAAGPGSTSSNTQVKSTSRASNPASGSMPPVPQGRPTIPALAFRPTNTGPRSTPSAGQGIPSGPASMTSAPVLATTRVSVPSSSSNIGSARSLSTPQVGSDITAPTVGLPGFPRPQAIIPRSRMPPVTGRRASRPPSGRSSSADSSSDDPDEISEDEQPIVRPQSDGSHLAKRISGLQVSASAAPPAPLPSGAHSTRDSVPSGQKSGGSDQDVDSSQETKDDSDGEGPQTADESPQHEIADSADEGNDETIDKDYGLISNPLGVAYAGSQLEMDEDDDDESKPTQAKLPDGTAVYDEYSARLISAHDEDLDSLLRAAMDLDGMPCGGWVQKRKDSKACPYEHLLYSLWMMMVGWDPLILKHLVHGNIPAQRRKIPELQKKLNQLRNLPAGIRTPSIYMQYLVDRDGNSPPPKVLLEILDHVEVYTNGLEGSDVKSNILAMLVDTASPTKTWSKTTVQRGERRYIEGPNQAKTCLAWVEASRQRLDSLPEDVPLARPWAECGYATVPNERLEQHARHSSSNYLMNLTEAICKAKFAGRFYIEQYVVHHIAHHTHAMYGEILASRIALVYTRQGGGFCHFKAGVSHSGAEKAEKADAEYYTRIQKDLCKDADFIRRTETEIQKIRDRISFHGYFVDVGTEQREAIGEIFSGAQVVTEKLTGVRGRVKDLVDRSSEDTRYPRDLLNLASAMRIKGN